MKKFNMKYIIGIGVAVILFSIVAYAQQMTVLLCYRIPGSSPCQAVSIANPLPVIAE